MDEVSYCLGAQRIWSFPFPLSGECVAYPPKPWGGEIGVGKAGGCQGALVCREVCVPDSTAVINSNFRFVINLKAAMNLSHVHAFQN